MNGLKRLRVLGGGCGLVLALALAPPSLASGMKSPEKVKSGLSAMNAAVADTGRLIAAKSYDQIAREDDAFSQSVGMLRKALADERASLRSEVNPLLTKALASSDRLAAASKSQDEAKIAAAQASFAAAVGAVIEEFPDDVRP
jgi:hypothetical protein